MKYLLLVAIIVSVAFAGSEVLSTDDFISGKVTNQFGETRDAWFIEFYNPRCPHCKKFHPVWEQIADDYTGKEDINFGSLDCSQHKPVCDRFNIWGVPTLLVFKDNYALEYQNSNDYDRVTEFIRDRGYDNEMLTERWPIPSV